jgi:hypothetical protein
MTVNGEELTLHEDGAVFIPTQFDQALADGCQYQFKRLKDRKPGESWILLYYGASGSGKTFFCGTAGPRTLFINIGLGMETLSSPAFKLRYPEAAEMIFIDITEKVNERGVLVAAEAFDLITDAIDYALDKFPNDFDTIVIDDATYMRRAAMNRALEINAGIRTQPNARSVNINEFTVPEIQDYGREMQMIEWFLIQYVPKLRTLKKNLVMTAHERNIYGKPARIGDQPPLLKTVAGFTGKTFPDQIPAYFDDVFRAEAVGGGEQVVYRARTAGAEYDATNATASGALLGKARHGGIFKTVEPDPNFLRFLQRIRAGQPHNTFVDQVKRAYGPNSVKG